MNSKSNTQAMETEKVPRLLAQLAIPAVVAQVINLLYNIVDRIYIGHISGVGAAALTGVGLFTPILMLINAFAMLAGSGGAPRAAIFMGKKDNKTAEKILGNCFALLIVMAVALTAIFFIFAPQLLTLFGASDKTLPYGVAYARIYILGSIFVLIVMGMNPFITTQGFAKISMMTTVIGAVINIILDPIFIFGFNLGVRGAAIATVLSQAVGAIWILRFLSGKKTILHLRKENFKLQKDIILPLSCTWYFYLCHVIYRKYPVCQLHVQPFKVWRGSCCWSYDNYYKCQPACHITITGNLSGWTANHEL